MKMFSFNATSSDRIWIWIKRICTSKLSRSSNIESHLNSRTRVWTTGRGNNEAISAPADRNDALSRCKHSHSRRVAPCQVRSTQGSSFIFVVLLRKATTIRRCIFRIDGNETVSIRLNGSDETIKRCCRWLVGSNLNRRNKLFEESKWNTGDGDVTLSSPDYEGIIELLRNSRCCEIPRLYIVWSVSNHHAEYRHTFPM